MRVVVDTNILVSALIRPTGSVGRVLWHLRQGSYTLLYTQLLLEELVDVLTRPSIRNKYGLWDEDVKTVLALILLRGEAVVVDCVITGCRDAKDNKFLEAAVSGQADLIVSGDKDLLVLYPFETIPVISPTAFLDRLDAEYREENE